MERRTIWLTMKRAESSERAPRCRINSARDPKEKYSMAMKGDLSMEPVPINFGNKLFWGNKRKMAASFSNNIDPFLLG